MGRSAPSGKFGTPQIWETIRARKLKFYRPLDETIPLFANEFFCVGHTAPSVNLEPPHISETVRARKLKFYTALERDNSTFRK